jgi:pterin-4a-carbinolamine dehydratase
MTHFARSAPDEVLSIDEARRLGWRVEPNALVRDLAFRDRTEAVRAADYVTDHVHEWGGRLPDMAIEAGRLCVTCANVNNAGVTLAELRLAKKVDLALELMPAKVAQL